MRRYDYLDCYYDYPSVIKDKLMPTYTQMDEIWFSGRMAWAAMNDEEVKLNMKEDVATEIQEKLTTAYIHARECGFLLFEPHPDELREYLERVESMHRYLAEAYEMFTRSP